MFTYLSVELYICTVLYSGTQVLYLCYQISHDLSINPAAGNIHTRTSISTFLSLHAVHLTRLEARAGKLSSGDQLTNLAIDPNVPLVHRLVSRSQAQSIAAAAASASTQVTGAAQPPPPEPSFLSLLQQRFASIRESAAASANKARARRLSGTAAAASHVPPAASATALSASVIEKPDGIELSQLPSLEVRVFFAYCL